MLFSGAAVPAVIILHTSKAGQLTRQSVFVGPRDPFAACCSPEAAYFGSRASDLSRTFGAKNSAIGANVDDFASQYMHVSQCQQLRFLG